MMVAADKSRVEKESEADGEGNGAEGCGRPGVVFDAGNQSEGDDVADGSGGKQDAGAARTGSLRKLGLHGDGDAAGYGGETFFGAQLAHAVVGVHRGDGNAERHDNCCEADEFSVHGGLLMCGVCRLQERIRSGGWKSSERGTGSVRLDRRAA